MGMSEDVLSIEKEEGVVIVTLNRPEAMNALSRELRRRLCSTFVELAEEVEVEAVILTGEGDRAFCAGLDLKELGGESTAKDTAEEAAPADLDCVGALERVGCPVIGAINGVAITGGFELALACDVLIGSTRARFADTHARVGIMPGWGLSQRLSRVVGVYRAKELSLTGNFLDAETAERWGLLNRVVEPEKLMETCRRLARDMCSCRPGMVKAYKSLIDRGFDSTLSEARDLERRINREHRGSVSTAELAEARRMVTSRGREQIS